MPNAAFRRPARPVGGPFSSLFVVLALLCTTPAAQAQQTYRLTRLGTQYANAIAAKPFNSLGQVIFQDRQGASDPGQGAFYDGTTTHRIGLLNAGTRSKAHAVNDAGQVVGEADLGIVLLPAGTLLTHAVLWSRAGGLVDLGSMGYETASAVAINASGQVVGNARSTAGMEHAFFWSSTTGMIDITPPGSLSSTAMDINASGQVLGRHLRADGSEGAFLWTRSGGWTELPLYPQHLTDAGQVDVWGWVQQRRLAQLWSPGTGLVDIGSSTWQESWSWGISQSGQVVGGYRLTVAGALRAFSWTAATGPVDLGNPGGPDGSVTTSIHQTVNRAGQVVGNYRLVEGGTSAAFVWHASTGMVDLQRQVIDLPAGLLLLNGKSIAENGNILAATNEGLALLSANPVVAASPVLGTIEAADPVATGRTLDLSAAFTDADKADTHTATWSWGDGSRPVAGTVNEGGGRGTVTASHAFGAPGTYTVTLTLTDSTGRSDSTSRDISVYDQSRGHIVGAGSFMSPPGAFRTHPKAEGNAVFALVTRYQPGESDPPGRMVFALRGTELTFRGQPQGSVTLNGTRASWSGTGRMNGIDGYRFAITALDARTPGALGRGRLHLRIWHADRQGSPVIDYDNLGDPATLGTLREGSVPQTGRILVRSRATP
ncbi:MAG: PKD domain-containing protein [Sphaerotilus natans]